MTGSDGEGKETPSDQPSEKSDDGAVKSSNEKTSEGDTPKDGGNGAATADAEAVAVTSPAPGITVSILVFWIIPVLLLAVGSHFVIDTKTPPKPVVPPNRPVSINMDEVRKSSSKPKKMSKPTGPTTAPSPTPYL